MQIVTEMQQGRPGGRAVVLLHGWGAPGDDLVGLAEALVRGRRSTRFFVPAAPLPSMGGGRAWWHLDSGDRPVHARSEEPPASWQPHPAVLAARTAVQALLRDIRERHQPEHVVLAGFSQGGMLSIDVALAADPPVDRVAVLSGALLADSLAALRVQRTNPPPVLVTHGRDDQVLPFTGAERLRDMLGLHGFAVTWRPFDGGHEIPAAVVRDLATFIDG
jgi:phospholipase/carboxylesterase